MVDKNLEDHLISAAQRGVDVRVVMSPSHFKNDTNAPGRDRIKRRGVKVRLLKSPYIHAKLLIADRSRAFVGSENFLPSSMGRNRELGILVSNSKIIQAYQLPLIWIGQLEKLPLRVTAPVILAYMDKCPSS